MNTLPFKTQLSQTASRSMLAIWKVVRYMHLLPNIGVSLISAKQNGIFLVTDTMIFFSNDKLMVLVISVWPLILTHIVSCICMLPYGQAVAYTVLANQM